MISYGRPQKWPDPLYRTLRGMRRVLRSHPSLEHLVFETRAHLLSLRTELSDDRAWRRGRRRREIPSAVATGLARERAEHRSRLRNASRTRRAGRQRDALRLGEHRALSRPGRKRCPALRVAQTRCHSAVLSTEA